MCSDVVSDIHPIHFEPSNLSLLFVIYNCNTLKYVRITTKDDSFFLSISMWDIWFWERSERMKNYYTVSSPFY